MKWSRLWQPRQPLFWLMLALNALSSLGAWALRLPELHDGARWTLAAVSLVNVALGLWAARTLLRTPAAHETEARRTPG